MSDQVAIERLEALVAIDKKASQIQADLDRVRTELREAKTQLKALKALDPERLKKNLAELKRKMVVRNAEINAQSKELIGLRKTLRDAKSELNASQTKRTRSPSARANDGNCSLRAFSTPASGPPLILSAFAA